MPVIRTEIGDHEFVVERANKNAFPKVGKANTLYVDRESGIVYRFDILSGYVPIYPTNLVEHIQLKAWQATEASIANSPYYNTTDKKVYYWNNDNHIWECSGHEGFIYKWSVSYYKFTAGEGLTLIGEDIPYDLQKASANTRGGIKASTKGATDTVEVKIDVASEKLYAPTYPVMPDIPTNLVEHIQLKAWQATEASIANSPYYNTTDKKVYYWNNDNHIWECSGHEGFIYKWSVSYYKFTAGEGLTLIGEDIPYDLQKASANTRGGIKASTKGATDTVEVKIDVASEKLYAPTYPVMPDIPTNLVEHIQLKAWQATEASIANSPYYNTTDKKVYYWNNDNHIWECSGHEGFIYKWSVSYYKFTAGEGLTLIGEDIPYDLQKASANTRGGIKASTKGATDTVEVKIDVASEKLYAPTYPVMPDIPTNLVEHIQLKAWQATEASIANSPYYNTTDKKVYYWNNDNHIWECSGHEGFIYKWSVSYYKFTAGEGLTLIGEDIPYDLQKASANTRGGIKASTKGATDTVEVKIDVASEKLYAPTYPVMPANKSYSKTITTANWVNKKYAVTIPGLKVSDTVILDGDNEIFAEYGLDAVIGTGTLTFSVGVKPSKPITIKYSIIKTESGGTV